MPWEGESDLLPGIEPDTSWRLTRRIKGIRIKWISQQNVLNKGCRECFFMHLLLLFFCRPKLFRPMEEKPDS